MSDVRIVPLVVPSVATSLLPTPQADNAIAVATPTKSVLADALQLRREVVPATQKFGTDASSFFARHRKLTKRVNIGTAISATIAGFSAAIANATAPIRWSSTLVCNNARPESATTLLPDTGPIAYALSYPLDGSVAVCNTFTASDASMHAFWSMVSTMSGAGTAALMIGALAIGATAVRRTLRGAKPMPEKTIEPLKLAFDGATGVQREVVRYIASEVAEDLQDRLVRGPEARGAVANIVNQKDVISQDDHNTASAIACIMVDAFEHDGTLKSAITKKEGEGIVKELGSLSDDVAGPLRNELLLVLFDKNGKPIPRMDLATELALSDALHGIKPNVDRDTSSIVKEALR